MPSSPSSSPSSSLLQPLSSDPADFAAARDVLPPSPPDAAATSNLLPAGWLDTQPDRQGRLDQNDHTLLSTERVRIDSSPDDLPNSSTKPKVVPWRWSCEACRHRKIKCDGVRPACGFCLKRNITPCVFLGNKSRVDECLASKHKAQIDKRAQRKAALEAHAQAKRANAIARKASARLGTNNVKVVAVAKPTDVTGPPTSVAVASTSSWKRLEDGLDDDERAGLKMGHRNHSTGGGAATVESNRSRDDNESSPELMVELGSSPAAAPVSSSRSSSFLLSESDSHNCQSLLPVSSIKDLEILLRSFTLNPAFNSHDEAKRPPTRTKLVRPGSMDGEERMLAESFFELPLPVTFVHRKTFLDNLETSSLVLRAAICAVSAGLQWKPIMSPADANWYSETARQLAKESFDEPAIETVQALLIMGYVTLRFASEAGGWQLLGIACRMAQFLELNVNPDTLSSLSWVEKETRRRCWAACYLFDRICATLRGRLPIVKRDLGSLTPLCREDLWLNREDTSSLPSEYFNARSAMENVSNYVIRHSELLITCTELAYPACLAADTPVLTVIEEGVYRQIVSFEGELPFKYSYFVTGEWPKDHMENDMRSSPSPFAPIPRVSH
ncbi:fungal-specific transcription factor domain-containing protein [Zopfochytrium polystomum]|nr:fungal-specific transcription factor domain-containing protein [Zopfochytrium polystomum]